MEHCMAIMILATVLKTSVLNRMIMEVSCSYTILVGVNYFPFNLCPVLEPKFPVHFLTNRAEPFISLLASKDERPLVHQ